MESRYYEGKRVVLSEPKPENWDSLAEVEKDIQASNWMWSLLMQGEGPVVRVETETEILFLGFSGGGRL